MVTRLKVVSPLLPEGGVSVAEYYKVPHAVDPNSDV